MKVRRVLLLNFLVDRAIFDNLSINQVFILLKLLQINPNSLPPQVRLRYSLALIRFIVRVIIGGTVLYQMALLLTPVTYIACSRLGLVFWVWVIPTSSFINSRSRLATIGDCLLHPLMSPPLFLIHYCLYPITW